MKGYVNIKYWASDLKNIPISCFLFWKKNYRNRKLTKYDHFLKCTLLFFLMCDIYFVCESKFSKLDLSFTVTLCSYFMSNLIIPRYPVKGWGGFSVLLSPPLLRLCFCFGRDFFLDFLAGYLKFYCLKGFRVVIYITGKYWCSYRGWGEKKGKSWALDNNELQKPCFITNLVYCGLFECYYLFLTMFYSDLIYNSCFWIWILQTPLILHR